MFCLGNVVDVVVAERNCGYCDFSFSL